MARADPLLRRILDRSGSVGGEASLDSLVDGAVARVERECPWPEGHSEQGLVACSGAQKARLRVIGSWLLRLVPPPARVVDVGTGQALLPAALAVMGYDAT